MGLFGAVGAVAQAAEVSVTGMVAPFRQLASKAATMRAYFTMLPEFVTKQRTAFFGQQVLFCQMERMRISVRPIFYMMNTGKISRAGRFGRTVRISVPTAIPDLLPALGVLPIPHRQGAVQ